MPRRPLHSRTPAATPVRRRPSFDFSFVGLTYCSIMMFLGIAAINSQTNLIFAVFGLMIGVLLVSGWIARLMLRKLQVCRVLPEQVTVGQVATLHYQCTNHKRYWPSLSVAIAELDGSEAFTVQPQAYMMHAAAGMAAMVPVQVIPKRRGLHVLDRYQLGTGFPFGFVKRAVEHSLRDTLLAHPARAEIDPKFLAACLSSQSTGATMRPRRGGADEFYGVREFRHGENPKWIYWRRSARTGTLVVREMTRVAPPQLMVLLDTHLPDRDIQQHALVERCIAMAGSLVAHAMESGLAIGLCAWSDGWVHISPNRGKRHCRDLLSTIARLPMNQSRGVETLLEESVRLRGEGMTMVLLTPRELEVGLIEQARGGWMVVCASSAQAQQWFRFDPAVDFTCCMPPDQQGDLAADH